MKKKIPFFFLLAALLGFAGGLSYAWLLAPVEYVDAAPYLLRADFKDQYRLVIAAAYAASHDLARARARLALLSADPLGDVNAQAQRMVGGADPQGLRLLTQLAADLGAGVASVSATSTPPSSPMVEAEEAPAMTVTASPLESAATPSIAATTEFIQTPFAFSAFTLTPLPTNLPSTPNRAALFVLVGQDSVCDANLPAGLLQITIVDSRRKPIPGVEMTVTSVAGEERIFTGLKPDVGDGNADFMMQANVSYSLRVGEGGTFITNLTAPACPNGLGGLSLAFQKP